MAEVVERVTLFVPGTPASLDAWNIRGLDPAIEVEWIENEGGFGEAFSFGTVAADVVAAIDAAPGGLLVHSSIDLREGRPQIVAAVERLRDAGAIAVRLEQSKYGLTVARWLELFSATDPDVWLQGAVFSLDGETSVQSCGMHAFSLPDVNVSLEEPRSEIRQLVSGLTLYQLAKDPMIRSGQTYGDSRRLLERWPDLEYPPDHACHNPYGVWRVGPAGATPRPLGALDRTFMPPLVDLLDEARSEQGKPLTQQQVESIRDQAVCVDMNPRVAQALERERGYADLDPQLAWEQWQAIQETR